MVHLEGSDPPTATRVSWAAEVPSERRRTAPRIWAVGRPAERKRSVAGWGPFAVRCRRAPGLRPCVYRRVGGSQCRLHSLSDSLGRHRVDPIVHLSSSFRRGPRLRRPCDRGSRNASPPSRMPAGRSSYLGVPLYPWPKPELSGRARISPGTTEGPTAPFFRPSSWTALLLSGPRETLSRIDFQTGRPSSTPNRVDEGVQCLPKIHLPTQSGFFVQVIRGGVAMIS